MENTKKVAANAATAFNATNEYATLYDLRLSEHFTLRNLALSGAVIRHRIANVPTAEGPSVCVRCARTCSNRSGAASA